MKTKNEQTRPYYNFTNKSFRGFTLIELLVVIAIIGLLGTIISGPINNARNKAKDAKKIADLKSIQHALTQYADTNNQFPTSLSSLVPLYLDALPGNATSTYTPQNEKYVYITYANASGVIYGYHLAAKLLVSGNAALDNDADCTERGSSNDCMTTNPTTITNTTYTSNQDPGQPSAATGGNSDFNTATVPDSSADTCVAATASSCIYDLRASL